MAGNPKQESTAGPFLIQGENRALIEKDIKLVPTIGKTPVNSDKFYIKDHFNYQHTFINTFTKIRGLELTEEPDSFEAQQSYLRVKKDFFSIGKY